MAGRGEVHAPAPTAALTHLAHVSHDHVGQVTAADFFVVPTATYRLLFVLVIPIVIYNIFQMRKEA